MTIAILSLSTFLAPAQRVLAESVMVRATEAGQGYLLSHRGNCYVVTAAHVIGDGRRAQIITSGGDETNAVMQRPFWAGFDVAIGVLRSAPRSGCGPTSGHLAANVGRSAPGRIATLPFVARGGVINVPIRVDRVDYLELTGRVEDPEQEVQKGMSGGFMVLDGKPLGMARAVNPDGTIQFVRMEEIQMNLDRWFNQSGAAGAEETIPIMPQEEVDKTAQLELISSSPLSIGVDHTAETMLIGEGPWIPEGNGPAELIVRNSREDGSAPTLSRMQIEAEMGDGFASPKSYRIDVAALETTEPRWRLYAVGEMPPGGVLDTGLKARVRANMIRIQILTTWDSGRIGIKSVRIE